MSEPAPTPAVPPRRGSCLLKIAAVLGLLVVVLGGLWWWHNRPIRPVTLAAAERAVVDDKLNALRLVQSFQPPPRAIPVESPDSPPAPTYQKGAKEIILTQRELNGLLNDNTQLGKTIQFELAADAVHARIETTLPEDFPILGGKRIQARARFLVHQDTTGAGIQLEDVTVWGISLPNEWLGGIKGKNLLGEIISGGSGGLAGVKELKVETGRLVIRLKD